MISEARIYAICAKPFLPHKDQLTKRYKEKKHNTHSAKSGPCIHIYTTYTCAAVS